MKLTDEQIDNFRRTSGSFGNMVQVIFDAGRNYQAVENGKKGGRATSEAKTLANQAKSRKYWDSRKKAE